MKDWADMEQLVGGMPLGEGYRFELLKRTEVGALIGFIKTWFPDISVGGASCYLRNEFCSSGATNWPACSRANATWTLCRCMLGSGWLPRRIAVPILPGPEWRSPRQSAGA